MKTTSYTTEKEIRIGILLVVFTIATFTAFKVKEPQLNDAYSKENTGTNHTMINHTGFPSLPVLDAKLIEEPALESKRVNERSDGAARKELELSLRMESWMNNSTYWAAETKDENAEVDLIPEIKNWINSKSYWAAEANYDENTEADLAPEIRNWINNKNYWAAEANDENTEAELAQQIESWMMTKSYWTGDTTQNVEAETTEGEPTLAVEQ